jgi:hypothetical protein
VRPDAGLGVAGGARKACLWAKAAGPFGAVGGGPAVLPVSSCFGPAGALGA